MLVKAFKNSYRTFSGITELIELQNNNKYIIYENNVPTYFVDLFDISVEANSMMNSLTLCAKRSIEETIDLLNQKNNTNLSIAKPSKIGLKIKLKSEPITLELKYLPEEWLDYSL